MKILTAQSNFCDCCGEMISSNEGLTAEMAWDHELTICNWCVDELYNYKEKKEKK